MKIAKHILIALFVILSTGATAKKVQVPHVYMFGFSASFQDSTIYMTDIQDVPNAWMEKKTKFLLGRDSYSFQLKSYLADQQQPNRVCVVFFSKNKKKLEKRYEKLRKKYIKPTTSKKKKKAGKEGPASYDVKYISSEDFHFETVDMSD